MAALLQDIHNVELMFGEYLGETVRFFDGLRRLRRLVMLRVAQSAGIQDVRAQPQLPGSFSSDGQLIARNHLDLHAHLPGAGDGCFGLLARRIEQWQHANKLPLTFLICPRHAQ